MSIKYLEQSGRQAGLKVYDVLLHFNDQILINSAQLKALVRMKRAGDLIDLKILRKGNQSKLKVTLSEVEKPKMPKNSHVFGLRNTDIFSGDPFSSNLDHIMPNLDPSISGLTERTVFSQFLSIDPASRIVIQG